MFDDMLTKYCFYVGYIEPYDLAWITYTYQGVAGSEVKILGSKAGVNRKEILPENNLHGIDISREFSNGFSAAFTFLLSCSRSI